MGGLAGVSVAPPEAPGNVVEGELVLDEPGRYALLCFIPTGADPDGCRSRRVPGCGSGVRGPARRRGWPAAHVPGHARRDRRRVAAAPRSCGGTARSGAVRSGEGQEPAEHAREPGPGELGVRVEPIPGIHARQRPRGGQCFDGRGMHAAFVVTGCSGRSVPSAKPRTTSRSASTAIASAWVVTPIGSATVTMIPDPPSRGRALTPGSQLTEKVPPRVRVPPPTLSVPHQAESGTSISTGNCPRASRRSVLTTAAPRSWASTT